jgi:hypothetical protein
MKGYLRSLFRTVNFLFISISYPLGSDANLALINSENNIVDQVKSFEEVEMPTKAFKPTLSSLKQVLNCGFF